MANGSKELHTSPITIEDEINEFSEKPVKGKILFNALLENGKGTFVVNFTEHSTVLTADKTFDEIYEAYANGKAVIGKYDSDIYYLVDISTVGSICTFFSRITVLSENELEYPQISYMQNGSWSITNSYFYIVPPVDSADKNNCVLTSASHESGYHWQSPLFLSDFSSMETTLNQILSVIKPAAATSPETHIVKYADYTGDMIMAIYAAVHQAYLGMGAKLPQYVKIGERYCVGQTTAFPADDTYTLTFKYTDEDYANAALYEICVTFYGSHTAARAYFDVVCHQATSLV